MRRWTPLKIAKYCGAGDTVVALLEKGIGDKGPTTPETEDFISTRARDGGGSGCDFCASVGFDFSFMLRFRR